MFLTDWKFQWARPIPPPNGLIALSSSISHFSVRVRAL
ncbi:hypothetical protein U0070_027020, partial [Myodes glareolus]